MPALCGWLHAQSLVYTGYIGGNRSDTASSIAVDAQGNAYVTGITNSTNFPRTQYNPALPPSGNLLASNDGGKTFSRGLISDPVLTLAATPAALIAGTPAGPYRSVDGGATWQSAFHGISGFAVNALLTDARFPARVYAATDQGLYRSDDSGMTWGPIVSGLPAKAAVNLIVASPMRPDTIFVVANQGVFRSQDAGLTWTVANLPISNIGPAPTTIAIDPQNPNIVYVAGAYSNTNQQAFLLKSADGGTTYQQISALAVLTSTQAIVVDPGNSASVFAAGIDGRVYHSMDGGNNWVATNLAQLTLDAVAFDPFHPANLYVVTDQGLLMSPDHGVTWALTGPAPKRDLRTIFFTMSTVFLGEDAGEHTFLTKWDPNGNLLWSIVIGGSYFDDGAAVAIDSGGNPYVTGTTGSTDFPVTPGAYQTALNGFQNIFLAKFSPDGNRLLYATYLGGSGSDGVSGLAIDSAGSAYLAGYAVSADFPTTAHAFQPRHNGACNGQAGGDAFVAKFSPDASSLAYSTLIGGSCAQTATAIAVDARGDAFVTGATVSGDFPVTKGVVQPTFGGSIDGFLSGLTPAGDALLLSTYLGGQNADIAAGVALDSSGNIFVAGNGIGFSFAASPPPSQLQCGGTVVSYGGLSLPIASPPYLLRLNPSASAVASLQNFSTCGTIVEGLAVDAAGRAWMGGIADLAAYDTVSPFQALGAGGYFVRQFGADGRTTLFSTLLDGFQNIAVSGSGAAYVVAAAAAPGVVKEGQQPSVEIEEIDTLVANKTAIDSIQKVGALSIPALANYGGSIGIAPGEVVAIHGHGLGGPNVTVYFDGRPAPLLSAVNNQIVCVVPYEVSGEQRSQVQVTNLSLAAASNQVAVNVVPAAVEVLQLVNQDGTVNSAAHPAQGGSTMTLYVSGLGAPTVPVADGSTGIAMNQTFLSDVSVAVDDPAPLSYLGPAPGLISGVSQINFVVPQIPGQSILSVSAGKSTDYVYLYVK